jgi:transposase
MQVLHERCAGLDIHKATVVACVMTPAGKEIRTFKTFTADLLALAAWLTAKGCRQVAMESTGVYWKPIYNLLEAEEFELTLANARHIKAVPGRKTDVRDAEWICDLLRHGLLRPSFVPDRPQRELRELVRYRRSLLQERAREANRIQKVLEGANIKLSMVISNILGVAGQEMLKGMAAGEEDPTRLADRATTQLKATRQELERALTGRLEAHQRFLLSTQLRHIEYLTEEIARLDAEVDERLRPFADAVKRLDTIPGVGKRTAEDIIAAIGTDMSRFPTAKHLASWAKLCPGTHESAGKRGEARTGKANPFLRAALVEAAKAVGRSKKETYLRAQYHRLAARRGKNKATIAVAHSILGIAYALLRDGTSYEDLGPTYFDERDREQVIRRSVKRLEALNVKVTIEPAA